MSFVNKHLIIDYILDKDTFVKAVFSGEKTRKKNKLTKIVIRPVLIKQTRMLQFSYLYPQKDITKNYSSQQAEQKLLEILLIGFAHIFIYKTDKVITVTNQHGKMKTREKILANNAIVDLSHDRQKSLIFELDKPDPYLQLIGIMTKEGKIKADMQSKLRQINEFLKLISQTIDQDIKQVNILDCGCGNAYLTFAAYHYFANILKIRITMTGIDLKNDLLRKHEQTVKELGWTNIHFETTSIRDYAPKEKPDIVLALHACDTASDDALAIAIKSHAQYIFCAPCCHHHVQKQFDRKQIPFAVKALFKDGIFVEKLGDVLTDTFRAMLLRIHGYQTDVMQFIPQEFTPKNLMIRAVFKGKTHNRQLSEEYHGLKKYFHVSPYLEKLLEYSRLR